MEEMKWIYLVYARGMVVSAYREKLRAVADAKYCEGWVVTLPLFE